MKKLAYLCILLLSACSSDKDGELYKCDVEIEIEHNYSDTAFEEYRNNLYDFDSIPEYVYAKITNNSAHQVVLRVYHDSWLFCYSPSLCYKRSNEWVNMFRDLFGNFDNINIEKNESRIFPIAYKGYFKELDSFEFPYIIEVDSVDKRLILKCAVVEDSIIFVESKYEDCVMRYKE
ncbi:MAG: hypothetical protein HOD63_06025 [Bacteroidetes bacterium]|jgi:hypothetical protein|nr:hypothetical protein [Bacteroidota bacterium]MBT3802947.1 hypothetical protein [Bacteroidota bacterium]MBT4338126.1 hypothetical protein [Bacteroidota bacterium]MBT4727286.1 hypothetical protein [Bacteroidota bacterium]MBT5991589.1 hypothetical protein [Bacteroidota bacterium]